MSYVDPGSFASGAVLTAAQVQVIADDVRYLKSAADLAAFTGVSLGGVASQSITSGTGYQSLQWGSAYLMVGGTWWTTGTNITVPAGTVPSGYTSAILEVQAQMVYSANGTGTRQIQVTQNGTSIAAYSTTGISGETTTITAFCWISAADGDALLVQGQQNSGSTLTASYMRAQIKRIGAV